MVIVRVDFPTGSFILRDPSMDMRVGAFLIGNIILCIIATICLSLKEKLILFFNLSVFLVISAGIWAPIYEMVDYSKIPIKDSVPLFLRALKTYRMTGGLSLIDIIVTFLYYIGVMVATLGIKRGYKQVIIYLGRSK